MPKGESMPPQKKVGTLLGYTAKEVYSDVIGQSGNNNAQGALSAS